MNKHGLYKYVHKGNIIYIGKSNSCITRRALEHKREDNFKPYLDDDLKIYICDLPNTTETDIMEKVLINYYKPVLNTVDNYNGCSGLLSFNEPDWIDYDDYIKKLPTPKNSASKHLIEPHKMEFFLFSANGLNYYLEDSFDVKINNKRTKVPIYKNRQEAIDIIESLTKISLSHGEITGDDKIHIESKYFDRNIYTLIEKVEEFQQWPLLKYSGNRRGWGSQNIISRIKGYESTITDLYVRAEVIIIFKEFLILEKLRKPHGRKTIFEIRQEYLRELCSFQ